MFSCQDVTFQEGNSKCQYLADMEYETQKLALTNSFSFLNWVDVQVSYLFSGV